MGFVALGLCGFVALWLLPTIVFIKVFKVFKDLNGNYGF